MVTNSAEAIARREPFEFGELTVTFEGDEAVIHGPRTGKNEPVVDGIPSVLRQWVRFDDAGTYRPLPGARTMRKDWQARVSGAAPLREALDAIYPLALLHAEQWSAGILRIVALDEVLQRQSGRYESSSRVSAGGRRTASDVLCGRCVKTPAWRGDRLDVSAVVCPEPCSVLVSLCREAAAWETNAPPPAPVDAGVRFAQFETPGNEIREAYLASRPATAAAGPGEAANRARRR
jgi:hypothetical protein